MAQVMAGGVCREIDVVILDKDGTLTDFHAAWGERYARSVGAMVEAARGDNALKAALCHTLAINTANGGFLQDCPIVSVKISDKAIMVATVLHQSGIEWSRAQAIVAEHMLPVLTAPSEPHQICGIGNIQERVPPTTSVLRPSQHQMGSSTLPEPSDLRLTVSRWLGIQRQTC
jgi:phosphoglycolate phosphatase